MPNLPLAFGEIVAGGIILLAGISGKSIGEVMTGQFTVTPFGSNSGNTTGVGSTALGGTVNPVPGAVATRLDQGIDVTGKTFQSPYAGKVVVSNASDPGWKGGGYVAVANIANPSQVTYFAEGISPIVKVGDLVQPGQLLGVPRSNPYNGTIGNIELGPANPTQPSVPLAHSNSNPAAVVDSFYKWLLGLGGPTATSTSNAGRP